MTNERLEELLQNCVDHFLIGADVREVIEFLIGLIGFTEDELIYLGFDKADLD